jgi:hypothetical protein
MEDITKALREDQKPIQNLIGAAKAALSDLNKLRVKRVEESKKNKNGQGGTPDAKRAKAVLTSSFALTEVGPTLAQQVPVLSTAEALADYAMQPKWSTPALITSAALSGNENFSKMIGDKELKQIIDSADVKFQEDLCNLKRLQ